MTDPRPKTPMLDRVQLPADLKGLSVAELRAGGGRAARRDDLGGVA